MSRTALPYRQKVRSEVAIFSQNVNRNYGHVETTLAVLSESSDIDIIFIQEPPWNIIRAAPSTIRKEGDDVIGAPLHPDWNCMVRPPTDGLNPRVLCYVHKRLAPFRPSYRRDLIDSRDVMVLALFVGTDVIHLANIYNDDEQTALTHLQHVADSFPAFSLMTGDFNLHSSVWNNNVLHH